MSFAFLKKKNFTIPVEYLNQLSKGLIREMHPSGCFTFSLWTAMQEFLGVHYDLAFINEAYYRVLDAQAINSDCYINSYKNFVEFSDDRIIVEKVIKTKELRTKFPGAAEIWLLRRYDPDSEYATDDSYVYHFVLGTPDSTLVKYDPWPNSRTGSEGELYSKRIFYFRRA